jgi:predicted MFS family arabinose efflux permease
VLRHPAVRRLWLASATTAVVLWTTQIAVTVQVLRQHSVATLAVVGLVGSLPALAVMPFAGILADRWSVRRLSLLVIAGQAGCLLLLAAVGHTGLVALTLLYAFQSGLAAFWPPARQKWLYGVVPTELHHPANAAIGSINGVMTLIGAAFGGLLSAWRPDAAILAAAVLQVVTLILLAGTTGPAARSAAPAGPARLPLLGDLADGLRGARDFPLARSIVWIGIAWGLIGGGYNVLLAGRITEDLHGGPLILGLVYAVDGLSVIIATMLAGRLPRGKHLPFYGAAYVVQGIAWALAFLAPSVSLLLAALVVMRLASGYVIALDTTILLATVPDRLRGRIAGLHMTTYNAVARISLAALGAVLTTFGIAAVGATAGIASAVFGIAWWCWSGRPARARYRGAEGRTDDPSEPA